MGKYEQVIVIGYGVITRDVLATVWQYWTSYGYKVIYIEHEVYPFNVAMKFAKANEIETEVIEDKAELTTYFYKATRGVRTLIISASNNYIFPSELVGQDNITIINFHNALLPDLPGRNAPSWAIYEGREKTGITWHYVTAGVDEGDIIIQKECAITSDMKAYELVAVQMKLAAEAFAEIYESVLNDDVQVMKQCFSNDRKLYKSKDIPGGGTFDLEDNPKDIYTLLRALDYGKSDVFPMVTTQYHGERVRVRRYKKVDTADVRPDEYKIYLPLEDNKFLMLRIDKLQNIGGLGGVIDDIEYLHWMIHELKQVTRRLVSNLYIADDEIQKLIDTKKILYEYVPGAYLNFWYGEQGFVRLFFYTVNIDVYKAPFIKGEVVCELFFAKEMADNEVVERSFIEKGFERYSVYHKWTRKKITTSIGSLSADYDVTYNQSDGFDEGIRACFDLYSDHVPDHDNMKRFLRQNTLYAFRKNGETIAGLVVSENGKIQTEEFIFVKPDFRGQGLARQLHETWDRDAQKVGALCVAWIRDDNEASIKLHEQLGYIRQEVHKITLKKGIIKNG